MKIFLSGIEGIKAENQYFSQYLIQNGRQMKWLLMSYYYARNHLQNAVYVKQNAELVLIDSGAHSFQFGKKVDWLEYTKQYAEFIKQYDAENVLGYFEMDVDNIIGYDKVLQLRSILESVSSKIIPVWHKNRGIRDYIEMCQKYEGKVIAIGGFRKTDIKDDQYISFMKTAKKYRCKVHCLGMTRKNVLDKVPFDFTDSATWVTATNSGHFMINGSQPMQGMYRFKKAKGIDKFCQYITNYDDAFTMQIKYYEKWKAECND